MDPPCSKIDEWEQEIAALNTKRHGIILRGCI